MWEGPVHYCISEISGNKIISMERIMDSVKCGWQIKFQFSNVEVMDVFTGILWWSAGDNCLTEEDSIEIAGVKLEEVFEHVLEETLLKGKRRNGVLVGRRQINGYFS